MPPALEDESGSSDNGEIPHKKLEGKDKAEKQLEETLQDAATKQDDEDDEEVAEDEYVVKSIVSHGFDDNGILKFQVDWVGYGEADRTWEPEENLTTCPEELKAYYKRIGGKPTLDVKKAKLPNSASAKKRKLSESGAEASPSLSTKRGRKQKLEEDSSLVSPEKKETEWTPPSGSWEDVVVSIDAMERDDENGGKIYAYVVWRNLIRTRHDLSVVKAKCPQKMLDFYEAHLHFNPQSPNSTKSKTEKANGTAAVQEKPLEKPKEDLKEEPKYG